MMKILKFLLLTVLTVLTYGYTIAQDKIVHDAEYYVVEAQNGDRWTSEDKALDKRLKELKKKHGKTPNIVYILWDDMAFGDAGIPAINKIRGFDTPQCNRMAKEGMMFTRMYAEPSCTPTRAAVMTGRQPYRNGMYIPGFPVENGGLASEEVTIAEVLSQSGYTTAFYGKGHLGDIEESYLTNQGFDEALFTPYNQVLSLWNPIGEGANAIIGMMENQFPKSPYQLDNDFLPRGWIMNLEGKKGQEVSEWGAPTHDDYLKVDAECEKRTIEFIRKNAKSDNPFFVCYWPQMTSFIASPQKSTVSRSLLSDGFTKVDAFIGQVMDELNELGIAENTLLVAMADNGPMIHNPPPGLGMVETIFTGGKGDHTEGGVRVPAFAWWPGTIKAESLAGDIIHVTDLYTTFARIGGATDNIPTDRVVDGIDQTSLLLNGDTFSRRDYVHIYTGLQLKATVKAQYKQDWSQTIPGMVSDSYYDLQNDIREKEGLEVPLLHFNSAFVRMKERHLELKEKYPDKEQAKGPALTGISNARPETKNLAKLYSKY
jgi:arylsulfatase A-like enzyme